MRAAIGGPALAAAVFGLVCGLGCVAGVSHDTDGGAVAPDMVVRQFCRRFGHESGSGILLLFADTARFDLAGLNVAFLGRENIRNLLEYGTEVNSRLSLTGLNVDGNAVTCSFTERNDWLGILGVSDCRYDGRFVVDGTRIAQAQIEMTPASTEEIGGRFASFVVWLQGRDPRAVNRLLPGGRLAYSGATARELLARLREWRAGSR
jgi:hypothetical protein